MQGDRPRGMRWAATEVMVVARVGASAPESAPWWAASAVPRWVGCSAVSSPATVAAATLVGLFLPAAALRYFSTIDQPFSAK